VHYDYDALGRMIDAIDELGRKTSYDLDGVGNRIVTHYPDNTYVKNDYDNLGRSEFAKPNDLFTPWNLEG
jgi:YD repeat-containing protein